MLDVGSPQEKVERATTGADNQQLARPTAARLQQSRGSSQIPAERSSHKSWVRGPCSRDGSISDSLSKHVDSKATDQNLKLDTGRKRRLNTQPSREHAAAPAEADDRLPEAPAPVPRREGDERGSEFERHDAVARRALGLHRHGARGPGRRRRRGAERDGHAVRAGAGASGTDRERAGRAPPRRRRSTARTQVVERHPQRPGVGLRGRRPRARTAAAPAGGRSATGTRARRTLGARAPRRRRAATPRARDPSRTDTSGPRPTPPAPAARFRRARARPPRPSRRLRST